MEKVVLGGLSLATCGAGKITLARTLTNQDRSGREDRDQKESGNKKGGDRGASREKAVESIGWGRLTLGCSLGGG